MKAKIKREVKLSGSAHSFFPKRTNGILYLPIIYEHVYDRDMEIDIVRSLDPRFDYKFIFRDPKNPKFWQNGKVFWINREFLRVPDGKLEDMLFEIDIH